ncbi:polysaccharide pyruvyl transferase family protein [Marispirochaeta aestuarii]|uniref:polysaccharide pyruvyl transferase family protein n=1 Tax=Marispirochaeta aestuarii TaxID=1963862 RepID=UPI0029C6B301|nr:polysaccharide pyruvyl transferase family protein [Marispirochaeta aestuarii]
MKFANYLFNARGVNNLGDNMQLIAIDNIYRKMGINLNDVVYIDKNKLAEYAGEYVVLPVTMPLVDYVEGGISGRFSDYIIPVFLGLTMVKDELIPAEIEYYRKYVPIGCRDERTLTTMRNYGIESYLHGCITATLSKRDSKRPTGNKVFIVGVSQDLMHVIPAELKENAVFLTHLHSQPMQDPKSLMQEYYERYKREARLVITSLLHCTVPCMAAGIPVISLHNNLSYRYGWLEKHLQLYTKEDFDKIDWNPAPVEYEKYKLKLFKLTAKRLQNTFDQYSDIYDISYFYETREKKEYINDAFENLRRYIDKRFSECSARISYSIWGLTQMSEQCVAYIKRNFPDAHLSHVYDAFRTVEFHGLITESPDNLLKHPNDIVIVSTNGAKQMAIDIFTKTNKPKEDYIIWDPISTC